VSLRDLLTVYGVELARRARSRPYLIGLLIGGLGIVFLARLPGFVNAHVGVEQGRIVLAGTPFLTSEAKPLLAGDYKILRVQTDVGPPAPAELDAIGAGRFIALSSDARGLHVKVYSTEPATVDARRIARILLPLNLQVAEHIDARTAYQLSAFKVDVSNIGAKPQTVEQAQVARGVAFSLIFLLYLLIILNSQLTMAGVIEEKTNRIAELLVASIDPLALLYGKIASGATLAMLQMIVWFVAGVLAGASAFTPVTATATHTASPFDLGAALAGGTATGVVVAFVFFLIVGLLQYSTLFAGIGSLISRPEDLGSINAAMILPIIAALVVAIAALDAPNAPIVVGTSFIPLLSPFTMFARIATTQPPAWQIFASAAINVLALIAIASLAGRLYRVGMLLYGRPPTVRQIWTTIRG
jgi:ABC-2 type transport system permease protein